MTVTTPNTSSTAAIAGTPYLSILLLLLDEGPRHGPSYSPTLAARRRSRTRGSIPVGGHRPADEGPRHGPSYSPTLAARRRSRTRCSITADRHHQPPRTQTNPRRARWTRRPEGAPGAPCGRSVR